MRSMRSRAEAVAEAMEAKGINVAGLVEALDADPKLPARFAERYRIDARPSGQLVVRDLVTDQVVATDDGLVEGKPRSIQFGAHLLARVQRFATAKKLEARRAHGRTATQVRIAMEILLDAALQQEGF